MQRNFPRKDNFRGEVLVVDSCFYDFGSSNSPSGVRRVAAIVTFVVSWAVVSSIFLSSRRPSMGRPSGRRAVVMLMVVVSLLIFILSYYLSYYRLFSFCRSVSRYRIVCLRRNRCANGNIV